jgi:serine/threonine-protein kinase
MEEPATVTRLNAALKGRYGIEREVGQGGMATVYLARDERHNRPVAIKVLKPEFSAVVGAERFLAEIETTARLQHPHILPLFDSGEADGSLFYVMPYVEGETLRERLARERQLPVHEAVGIATRVADALQTAHEAGVVHRDIKPANILLSRGEPLVADFGIARAVGDGGGLTETGLRIGTPHYMSPEQATGEGDVGPASDTFSLACVLYEMLVGEPAYPGRTAQEILGRLIGGAPVSATTARASVPSHVDAAIRKALERLPADRFRSARDFATALADPSFRHGEDVDAGAAVPSARRWRLGALALAVTTVALALLSAWALTRPDSPVPPQGVMRFQIETSLLPDALNLALSPDGRQIAYVGESESGTAIWVRRLDSLDARTLPGTEGAGGESYPFWSPDGRFVAFRLGGDLKRVDVTGGAVETVVAGISCFRRGAWGADGTILFGGCNEIQSVPAAGGEPVAVTQLDGSLGEIAHSAPWFLPGGRRFLYKTSTADPENRAIYVGSRDPGETRRRLLEASRAIYVEPGFILFARERTLYARPFDPDRLEFTGDAVPIMENVYYSENIDTTAFEASNDGILIAAGVRPAPLTPAPLVWVDRSGTTTTPVGVSVEPGAFSLSQDGSRIAFFRGTPADIWTIDIERGLTTRLTQHPDVDHNPIWSPDGASVAFDSHRDSRRGIYRKPATGAVEEELLVDAGPFHVRATDWSGDGRIIVFEQVWRIGGGYGIWTLPLSGDRRPISYVNDRFDRRSAVLSPDGRWMAHQTNESGEYQVVVQPFPDPSGGKWQVSPDGGVRPRWARDGQELYYVDGAGWIVRVPITTEPAFTVGAATRVWQTTGAESWDVTPDGQRLVVAAPDAAQPAGASSPITVILNWPALLDAR